MQETPLLLTTVEAARRLGCGRTTVYELMTSGELESVKVGRLRRVPADALTEYVARMRAQARTPAA
jgi:excisionase family DNA binding protein